MEHAELFPVRGLPIGPPRERLRYTTAGAMKGELGHFWGMVETIVASFPGGYDDLPEWCTEDGTAQLEMND